MVGQKKNETKYIWIYILKIRGLPNFEFQGGSRHTIGRFGGLLCVRVCESDRKCVICDLVRLQ